MKKKNGFFRLLLTVAILMISSCATSQTSVFISKEAFNNGPYLVQKEAPETSITICWLTGEKKDSTVIWGSSESDMVNSERTGKSNFHTVTLYNLKPATTYFYSIQESFALFENGKVFSFRTAPEKNTENGLEFVITGDLQPKNEYTLYTNQIMAEQINREKPDFIIQTGDIVQIGSSRKAWQDLMESLPIMASERPIIPATGNHDYLLFNNTGPFRSFFPYNYPDKKSCYYSVDIGRIHIAFLDPFDGKANGMNFKMGEEQKNWFIEDLRSAVKNNADWLFVVLHLPVFTSGEYPADVDLQKWILPVLSQFDVDAVFYGHAHLYEHWRYQYGANGYLLRPEDKPGTNPVDFFCIGSSGASLESNYDLFTHKPFIEESWTWFNTQTGMTEIIENIQYPWNKEIFIKKGRETGILNETDFNYYHLPLTSNGEYSKDPGISYSTTNKWFGYMYGENTLHYAKVKVEKGSCQISIHYPDGTILKGPDGNLPQVFLLQKKDRSEISR